MVEKRPKTALNLVESALQTPPPPAILKQPGASFWRAAHADFQLGDAFALGLLEQVCSAMDRLAEVRERITGNSDPKLLAVECQLQGFITRTIAKLRPVEKRPVGRPPTAAVGWRGY